jgi:hypothetical protein
MMKVHTLQGCLTRRKAMDQGKAPCEDVVINYSNPLRPAAAHHASTHRVSIPQTHATVPVVYPTAQIARHLNSSYLISRSYSDSSKHLSDPLLYLQQPSFSPPYPFLPAFLRKFPRPFRRIVLPCLCTERFCVCRRQKHRWWALAKS